MDILEFFKTKRTYRKFKQEKIPGDVAEAIITAAQLYSCGANKQGLKYVVVNKPEDVRVVNGLVNYAAYLPKEVGTPKEDEIPVMFIAVIQDPTICVPSDTDAGLAIGNMQCAAWFFGVGSCIMGSIERAKLKSFLKIPENMVLHSMMAFGYPKYTSRPVPIVEDIKYYLDSAGNTCVPKRAVDDIVRFL